MKNLDTTTRALSFFFCDIEGSTKLVQKLGERYTQFLDEHQSMLRREFEKYGGEVITNTGDGFFVAFKTTSNAINCSESIQRKLSLTNFNGETVKLRIGIHTGVAAISESGYSGVDVNKTERIMSSGYGGQVLISEQSKASYNVDESKSTRLKYIGELNLRDFQKPEKIFQLVIDGLNSNFPPLQSNNAYKTNLPSSIVKLIGREKEFETIKQYLSETDTRVLTITGPGGMGKTSLGLNVSNSLRGLYSDGVYMVNLSCINEEQYVLSAIAKVLQVNEAADLNFLIEYLKKKNLLLFLDNFEQVTSAATIVREIISECPGVKMLVTSRIPLHVRAEKEFPLDSLTVPDENDMSDIRALSKFSSVRLFAERASEVNRNFKLTNENIKIIAEICRQLDGLPLAIELASARIKLFTPQMLLSKLSNRLDLLKGMNIDLPERHQTLRNTITWSYELLSEDEKKLFEILSVFQGGCSLEAIQDVCGEYFDSEYELFDSVEALVDKNLLRRIEDSEDETRFNMLLIIREYARELFEKDTNYKKFRDNHSYYYLKQAEGAEPYLTGADVRYWTDYLDRDIENFRSSIKWAELSNNEELALRLCASLWRFWIIRKNVREGYEYMKYVLNMPYKDSQKKLRARVLNGIATIAHEMNNYEEALPIIEESIKLYREVKDKKGEMYSLINLIWVLTNIGQPDKAEVLIEECKKVNEELKEMRASALIYHNLGWIKYIRGNPADARDYFIKSLEVRIQSKDKRGEGFARTNTGWAEIVLGNYDSAESYLKTAREIHEELSDKHLTSWTLSNLALLEMQKGNFVKAKELVEDSILKIRESVNEWGISYEILLHGIILYQLNEKQKGIETIMRSYTFYKNIKNKWGMRRAKTALGMIYLHENDLSRAKESLREALEIAFQLKDKIGFLQVFENVAVICLKNGNENDAKFFYSAAITLRDKVKVPWGFLEKLDHEENVRRLKVKGNYTQNIDKVIERAFEIFN